MGTKELRLGNYIQLLSQPNPVKIPTGIIKVVTGIKYFHLDLCSIDKPIIQQEPKSFDINDVDGILLTEEWFLKFGFLKDESSEDLIDFNLNNFFVNKSEKKGQFYYNHSYFKYVHQLQNLYFALTNKELCTHDQ